MRNLDWQDDVNCTPDMAAAFTVDYKPTAEEVIFLPAVGQGRHLAMQALARKVGAL